MCTVYSAQYIDLHKSIAKQQNTKRWQENTRYKYKCKPKIQDGVSETKNKKYDLYYKGGKRKIEIQTQTTKYRAAAASR